MHTICYMDFYGIVLEFTMKRITIAHPTLIRMVEGSNTLP